MWNITCLGGNVSGLFGGEAQYLLWILATQTIIVGIYSVRGAAIFDEALLSVLVCLKCITINVPSEVVPVPKVAFLCPKLPGQDPSVSGSTLLSIYDSPEVCAATRSRSGFAATEPSRAALSMEGSEQ